MHWWHAENYADGEACQNNLKTVAERRLERMFSQIDSTLGQGGPYLLGRKFSAIDYYLVMLCRWTRELQSPATQHPHLKALVDLVVERRGWKTMMLQEGTNWDGDVA